jgi:hypothetical protein
MSISSRFLLEQGATLRALGAVVLRASMRATAEKPVSPAAPTPRVESEVRAPSPALVAAFVRSVGGEGGWYRGAIPHYLFPQWTFATLARAMKGVPYPMVRAVNAGCRIEWNGALPSVDALSVRARLTRVEEEGGRALLIQEVETGPVGAAPSLRAEVRAMIPARSSTRGKASARSAVPEDARELAFARLRGDAGADFAKLTGDVNPLHWSSSYARRAGFAGRILHGFSTLARACAAVERTQLAGAHARWRSIDVAFRRPLVLPHAVGVYASGERIWVADAPGSAPYLEGCYAIDAGTTPGAVSA